MTITRIWQSGMELGSLSLEFDGLLGIGQAVVASNPKTGTYSFREGQ